VFLNSSLIFITYYLVEGARGGAVVEAFLYELEGRVIDPDGVIGIFY
jgi:hypothetical protein